jgi:hypothetical protein
MPGRRLDWAHFFTHIGRAHPGQIARGAVCLLCYYGVKAERWKHLIAPFGVEPEEALAASVIYNVLMVLPTEILEFPGLRRAGLELRVRLAWR